MDRAEFLILCVCARHKYIELELEILLNQYFWLVY